MMSEVYSVRLFFLTRKKSKEQLTLLVVVFFKEFVVFVFLSIFNEIASSNIELKLRIKMYVFQFKNSLHIELFTMLEVAVNLNKM